MSILFQHNSQKSGKGIGAFAVHVLLLSCLLESFLHAQPVPFASLGYAYEKTITIDPNLVEGILDLNDFPVLIRIIDPDIALISDGGYIFSPTGYDIVFIDEDGYKLDHEIESYSSVAGNGTYMAWVIRSCQQPLVL
jgi:hypothetical protein